MVVALVVLVRPAAARVDDHAAQTIELTTALPIVLPIATPITGIVVLDESICRAAIDADTVRLTGLKRGDTILVVWVGDQQTTFVVHVSAPAPSPVERQITARELEAIGYGTVGSMFQLGTTSSGYRSLSVVTPFSWTDGGGDRRFSMYGQAQGVQSTVSSNFTLDTVTARWTRGANTLQLFDVIPNLDGGAESHIDHVAPTGTISLRGFDALLGRGKTTYEFFGGRTLPWFAASRQLGGLTITRQQSDRVLLDATTSGGLAPVLQRGSVAGREFSAFQTVGMTKRLNDAAAVQVRGGAGTGGFYGHTAASVDGERLSAFASATGSSPEFGLNQLQLVYAPSAVVRTGGGWRPLSRLSANVAYDYTTTQPTALFRASSTSNYLSAGVSITLPASITMYANSVRNHLVGGLGATTPETTGHRYDAGISNRFGRLIANSVQVSSGSLADPLRIDSRSDFSLRDTFSVSLKKHSLNVSFSHDRLNPSLVARLRSQINLLSPELQLVFADDPAAFSQSSQLPADVRQLLTTLQPVDTQLSVSGQLALGKRASVSPTFSYMHSVQSTTLSAVNTMFGYVATWRATPTLELQSTLTNSLVLDPRLRDFARSTVFGIGLRKTLRGAPRWLVPNAGFRIAGRVFRDLNVDGVGQPHEPGLAGVTVRLTNRMSVRTDEGGRFEFTGLAAGEYHLSMPIDQLGQGVRVTTAIDQIIRLYEQRTVDVDFGVVNFSRVMGNVFNDLALDGTRQGDAPGLRAIALTIRGDGYQRQLVTNTAGDFEIDDIPPGQYTVAIDPGTFPANYILHKASIELAVGPSSTAVLDLPVRALRSMGGGVFLRRPAPSGADGKPSANGTLIPLSGVRVSAHGTIVRTDEEGRFLLRDLPAGELVIAVVPVRELPDDLRPPAGKVRMPMEPIQIENATIIIDNPRLVEYLTPQEVASR